jgi:hypothetical protein
MVNPMKTDSDPRGWRVAAFIVGLALVLTFGAYTIHKKTFCDPTHPSCMKIGSSPASHEAKGPADH